MFIGSLGINISAHGPAANDSGASIASASIAAR
jgi:hypothetical protein